MKTRTGTGRFLLTVAAAICCGSGDGTGTPPGPGTANGGEDFLAGGDVSLLARIEALGGVYRADGRAKDALQILKDHGCTCMRLRIFHSPNGRGGVVNDLDYTRKLARRIKAAGFKLLLDFHYSDTWADPGHQTKPAAWRRLPPDKLRQAVFAYTRDVVASLGKAGARPDLVQIGNEITPGMLWPTGRVGGTFDTPAQWRQLAGLIRGGIRGVRAGAGAGAPVRIMIHLDRGGSPAVTRWFFDKLLAEGVTFDVIGLSYYPWWHGSLGNLRKNLAATARRYRKDIVVVETAYPWRGGQPRGNGKPAAVAFPATPAGQKAFLTELIRIVRQTPDGRGKGVIYWAPEWIAVKGLRARADLALFDAHGRALPALGAFARPSGSRREKRGPPTPR